MEKGGLKMKINGSFYKTYSATVYNNSERYSVDKAKKNSDLRGDTVEISSDALRMERVSNQEISREERINALKKEIQAGRYTINAEAIADKIIEYIA